MFQLWFDVGIKRYTTPKALKYAAFSCGLMQESKDIQLEGDILEHIQVVV